MNLYNRFATGPFDRLEDYLTKLKITVPEDFNFGYDVVDVYEREAPDKKALVWCNDETERTFTFAEMSELSNRAAGFFRRHGIGKGDAVMLILKRRYQYWYALTALHKLGAVAIPATHLLTKKDLIYRNNAASVKMILTVNEEEIRTHVEAALPQSPTVQAVASVGGAADGWLDFDAEIQNESGRLERVATRKNEPILIYFTSGTSGHPKMVLHNHAYPLGHIVTAKYWQNVEDDGLHLTVSETGWAKAAWGKIYGQWICGAVVFVYDMEHFHAAALLEKIQKYRVSTFCAPPTIYRFMMLEDLSHYDFSSVKYSVVAGEPLSPEIFKSFYEKTGLSLKEGYGQTELAITVMTPAQLPSKPGSMGIPVPLYDVKLVDENGNPVAAGENGQIAIDISKEYPVSLFDGYYRDKERTDSVMHDGLYYTGDIAWKDEEGYLWFVGRADDVIKSSGYRIGPFEVESALLEHEAVFECAVTPAPDPIRGQVVKATIRLHEGFSPSEELKKELQRHVKETTAPYKYPRIIEFVDEMPKTISGKIRRAVIKGTVKDNDDV